MLPPGLALTHSIDYLRLLCDVTEDWHLRVAMTPMCHKRYASVEFTLKTKHATIYLNSEYTFTLASATRAIVHELLEISMAEMWAETVAVVPEHALQGIRDARDRYIEHRLRGFPYWHMTDIPVLRQSLDALCRSLPSKAPTGTVKRPRLRYCTSESQCDCLLS